MSKKKRFQFIVPESLKADASFAVQDYASHQGQPCTLLLARQWFFYCDMEKDVDNHVKCCYNCVLGKTPEPMALAKAPLGSIKTSAPLELVCIVFWSADDVLMITDHFTWLAHAFPCQEQAAMRVGKKLWDNFFCIYGFPQHLHTDQGANFESELIAKLLVLSGVYKSHTLPHFFSPLPRCLVSGSPIWFAPASLKTN